MQGFWKTLPMAAFMLAVSIFQMYTTSAHAQTVGNMPTTQDVLTCDSGTGPTSCSAVPTVPAEHYLKGFDELVKAITRPLEDRIALLEGEVGSLQTRVTTLEGLVSTLQGQQAAALTQLQVQTMIQEALTNHQFPGGKLIAAYRRDGSETVAYNIFRPNVSLNGLYQVTSSLAPTAKLSAIAVMAGGYGGSNAACAARPSVTAAGVGEVRVYCSGDSYLQNTTPNVALFVFQMPQP